MNESRRLALKHGFRLVGTLLERHGFQLSPIVVERWTDDRGTDLAITPRLSFFDSLFEDGFRIITWSLKDPLTRSTGNFLCRAGRGSFAEDLRLHRRASAARSSRALLSPALSDHIRNVEAFYRDHASILDLIRIELGGPLGTLVGVGLAVFFVLIQVSEVVVYAGAIAIALGLLLLHTIQARRREEETLPPPVATRCPYCHADVVAEESSQVCGTCSARHHDECWVGHGRCSACGYADPVRPTLLVPPAVRS